MERNINSTLRTMLLNNEDFDYAHFVKFERPSLPDAISGKVSTSAVRYTYITDGAINYSFDDGSTDLNGTANGAQIYRANKLLRVGSIIEETEAKASTFTLDIDGTAIGASVSNVAVTTSVVSTGVYDIVFPPTIDLVYEGFQEGDKVTIDGSGAFVDGDYCIHSFRTGNTLRVTKIDSTMTAGSFTITMSLSSEEIKSVLMDKTSSTYASFLNRYVTIYRAYIQNGAIVGAPLLYFKGIISNCSFEDNDDKIKVSWGLTSHWGDWAQVSGRITSDDFHRALDENGNPNPISAIKPLYAYDKGFIHSETSINLLAKYVVQVEKQKIKVKNGLFGIGSKVKVKKYLAPEERTSELDFQLTAKSLDVHYGVRPVSGIPVFVDTLLNDPSTVYIAYALGQGELGSLYDVYIDGNSLICGNKSDYDARSAQTADNTVQLICKGRADRGDVLGGTVATSGGGTSFYTGQSYLEDFGYNIMEQYNYLNYTVPAEAAAEQVGILDGETLVLSSPQSIALDFFSGRSSQKAAASLVNIAAANGFKIQNDYWTGTDTAEYWGPNHRLLDTAYVVAKIKIAEGETTIPDLEFITKGKIIPCYNYDYSYSQYYKATGESAANFKLGATVELRRSDTTAVIDASVQIIDKWTIYNPDGTANVRFRFSTPPSLGYVNGVPTITKFYMKSGANTWTMVTYNHQEHSGTVAAQISSPVNSITNTGGKVQFNFTSNATLNYGGDPTEPSPKFSILDSNLAPITNEKFGTAILSGTDTATTLLTNLTYTAVSAYATAAVGGGNVIASRNTIKLAAGASAVDDYYNGYKIVVTRFNSTTGKQIVQTKKVLDYDGTNKIVTIDDVWDTAAIPGTSDTYYLEQPYIDHRSSTNFAAITVDYITSSYGRGLAIGTDVDFATALQAMRDCDQRSDVTIRCSTAPTVTPTAGAVYKFTNTAGDILWQGTVSTTFTSTIPGTTTTFVTFTDIIGKLTNYWNSWKVYAEGELVYWGNNLYKATGSYVAQNTAPVHTGGTTNQLTYQSSLALTKVSGTGDSSLASYYTGNPVQTVKNSRMASGYSLYDSDGVDYWRYVGWESRDQRWVTKHQGNITIDTSQPVFDNTNGLLAHFGGILRYNAGLYYLEVETTSGTISTSASEPANITEDHIIGKIRLTDEGIRGAYNSLAVSYGDPANKFEARNISFFNSDYLKEDRNIPRKGNLSIPGITNYYNARFLADRYLNKSRFGSVIDFTIAPRGLILVPGNIIQLQYSRYGWVNKKFRIESMTLGTDALVDIVAKEYDDSFYTASNVSKQSGVGLSALPVINTISAPSGLSATEVADADATSANIAVSWANSSAANSANTKTEIYSHNNDTNIASIASNVATCSAAHGLSVNDIVVAFNTANGLTAGNIYYVLTTPASTTLTLSSTLGGSTLALTNGTGLTIGLGGQALLTTVDCPGSSYSDIIYTTAQVNKYYRIRHKQAVTQNGGAVDQYSEYHPTTTAILGSTIVDVTIPSTGDIDLGTADNSLHASGTNTDVIFWAGSANSLDAPTKLAPDGTFTSSNFEQRDATGVLHWSSSGGYTQTGLNAIFENLTNQLPATSTNVDTVTNKSVAPSGTTDPGAAYRADFQLGADSTVSINVTARVYGSNSTDTFATFDLKVYERYSSTGDFSASTWSAALGTTTAVKNTDFTVYSDFVGYWTGLEFEPQLAYIVDPTDITLNISSTAKIAGYYQYAVVGPTASPWFSYSSTVTVVDTDSVPSFILSGTATDSVNFAHPLGSYSNLSLLAITGRKVYVTADMVVLYTPAGLPRTVRNFADSYFTTSSVNSGTDTFTTATAHGLYLGQQLVVNSSTPTGGLTYGIQYFVKTIPTSTTFTLAPSVALGSTVDLTDTVNTQFTIPATLDLEIYSTYTIDGLDSGTLATNTWYYIYMISNGTLNKLLASTSSTTPTMPSGYTYKKLIGACKTNASSNILPFVQYNDDVQFKFDGTNALPNVSGTQGSSSVNNNSISWAGISLSSYVPSNVKSLKLMASQASGSGFTVIAPNNNYDGYNGTMPPPLVAGGSGATSYGEIVPEGSTIYYGASRANGAMYFLGYKIKI